MKPAPFSHYRARSGPETVALLAEHGDGAKILAGGQSLVPMMNFRLARAAALVDVTRIPGLEYLRAGPGGLRIGALTRHRTVDLCCDPAVLDRFGVPGRAAAAHPRPGCRNSPLTEAADDHGRHGDAEHGHGHAGHDHGQYGPSDRG